MPSHTSFSSCLLRGSVVGLVWLPAPVTDAQNVAHALQCSARNGGACETGIGAGIAGSGSGKSKPS